MLSLLAGLIGMSPALAQDGAVKSDRSSSNLVLLPGDLRGFGTMGPSGRRRLCAPLSVGLYELRVPWVERLVRPTEAQKKELTELAAASAKTREAITAACPVETVRTSNEQLAVIEKRVAGLLEALKIYRPAYDKFYAALDSRQKARLDGLGPARRGWRL